MPDLENLGLVDILTLLESQPASRGHITDEYARSRFHVHNKSISIGESSYNARQPMLSLSHDAIELRQPTLAKTLLSHFGHLIQKLRVNSYVAEFEVIRAHVERYCAGTLREFTLIGHSGYFLGDTNYTFTNVTKLTLRLPIKGAVTPNISRIYPALAELMLDGSSRNHEYTGIQEYQHYLEDIRDYTATIRAVLQGSRPLSALAVTRLPSIAALEAIYASQPNVRTLSIEYDLELEPTKLQPMHFARVTHLSLKITNILRYREFDAYKPLPLRADHVQHLEIRADGSPLLPLDVIQHSGALKAVSLPEWHNMTDLLNILDMVNGTHAIEAVAIAWSRQFAQQEGSMQRLLNDFPQLQRITFIAMDDVNHFDDSGSDRDDLLTHIGGQWTVVDEVVDLVDGAPRSHVTIGRGNPLE